MLYRMMLAAWAIIAAVSPATAQQWARDLFPTTSHDFGLVPRSAKAEFSFGIVNGLKGELHIAGVRSSCGCTTPRIENALLKPYEKGAVVARLNTESRVGRQGATITVTIDQPAFAEVQLHVKAQIHEDVIIGPPSVQLGTVAQGAAAENTVRVYRGNMAGWRVREVLCNSPFLTAKVSEVARQGSQTWYDLSVRLAETAPAGYISQHVVLITNDPRAPRIPVLVEGQVVPPVSVSPASLFFGVLQSGDNATKTLVVRSQKPCRILAARGDPDSFRMKRPGDEPKTLHVLPVTFTAGAEWGKVVRVISIETDLPGGTAEVTTYAVVEPPAQ